MHRHPRPLAAAIIGLLLASCVAYRPRPLELAREADRILPPEREALAFEAAVRRLVAHNPELLRLRAEAAAVNLRPGPEPIEGSSQWLDGEPTETMIGGDVLSLLGIGPVRAERALARARQHELVMRHHERARALVAALAEAYATERTLRDLASPHPALDLEAFTGAGLISDATRAAAESAHAQARAEEATVAARLRDVRREIARLLGRSPAEGPAPVAVPARWPPVPPPSERALLLARGDLQRLLAAYETADRRFRLAVARQWPGLALRLGANVTLGDPMQMVAIRLPLDAPDEARAMHAAREAGRRAVVEGLHDAMHEAVSERLALEAAEASQQGAAARRAAAASLVRAAHARVTSEPEAADAAVLASLEEVRAAIAWREAAVAAARARVRAAHAAGWPTAGEVGGLR